MTATVLCFAFFLFLFVVVVVVVVLFILFVFPPRISICCNKKRKQNTHERLFIFSLSHSGLREDNFFF